MDLQLFKTQNTSAQLMRKTTTLRNIQMISSCKRPMEFTIQSADNFSAISSFRQKMIGNALHIFSSFHQRQRSRCLLTASVHSTSHLHVRCGASAFINKRFGASHSCCFTDACPSTCESTILTRPMRSSKKKKTRLSSCGCVVCFRAPSLAIIVIARPSTREILGFPR